MSGREEMIRWALDNPQPPTPFDLEVFEPTEPEPNGS